MSLRWVRGSCAQGDDTIKRHSSNKPLAVAPGTAHPERRTKCSVVPKCSNGLEAYRFDVAARGTAAKEQTACTNIALGFVTL